MICDNDDDDDDDDDDDGDSSVRYITSQRRRPVLSLIIYLH